VSSEWKTLDADHRVARAHDGLHTATFESRGWVVVVGLGAQLLQWHQSVYNIPDPRLLQRRY
jgi:hypothetical protein